MNIKSLLLGALFLVGSQVYAYNDITLTPDMMNKPIDQDFIYGPNDIEFSDNFISFTLHQFDFEHHPEDDPKINHPEIDQYFFKDGNLASNLIIHDFGVYYQKKYCTLNFRNDSSAGIPKEIIELEKTILTLTMAATRDESVTIYFDYTPKSGEESTDSLDRTTGWISCDFKRAIHTMTYKDIFRTIKHHLGQVISFRGVDVD